MSERTAGTVLDEYLVLQSQVGDSDAFGLLVQRWHARLVRHALRYTHDSEAAQDAAREAWLGIVRGLASLGDPALFRPWPSGLSPTRPTTGSVASSRGVALHRAWGTPYRSRTAPRPLLMRCVAYVTASTRSMPTIA